MIRILFFAIWYFIWLINKNIYGIWIYIALEQDKTTQISTQKENALQKYNKIEREKTHKQQNTKNIKYHIHTLFIRSVVNNHSYYMASEDNGKANFPFKNKQTKNG